MNEKLYGSEEISAAIGRVVQGIRDSDPAPWAIVGIRRGGEVLARRIAAELERLEGQAPEIGMVDISLYRDDGFDPHGFPRVGVTQLDFPLPERTVVLVDDVLYTGRTVRAALDVILDYGRPRAVRLAVLVDRGHRELPVSADTAGFTIATTPEDRIEAMLSDETPAEDAIVRVGKTES